MAEPQICFPCACGRALQAAVAHAGRWVRCPHCGQRLRIPAPGYQPAAVRPVMTPRPTPPRIPDVLHKQLCSICQT
jgi:hypothetical protein